MEMIAAKLHILNPLKRQELEVVSHWVGWQGRTTPGFQQGGKPTPLHEQGREVSVQLWTQQMLPSLLEKRTLTHHAWEADRATYLSPIPMCELQSGGIVGSRQPLIPPLGLGLAAKPLWSERQRLRQHSTFGCLFPCLCILCAQH